MAERAVRAEVLSGTEPEGVTFLDHTADFGLEVEAPTLEACFARVAAGLFASFAPEELHDSEGDRTVEFNLEARGLEELLVAWLEELLYEAEGQGLFFHTFEVDSVEGTRLKARAIGRPPGPEDLIGPPIKGVTRHDLSIRQEDGGWRARVILDV